VDCAAGRGVTAMPGARLLAALLGLAPAVWCAALAPPPQRIAWQLDPANVLTAGPSPAVDFSAGLTIELWLLLHEPMVGSHTLLAWQNPDGTGVGLHAQLDGRRLIYAHSGRGAAFTRIDSTVPLEVGRWTHVAVTAGPGFAHLYHDGVVVASHEDPAIGVPVDVSSVPLSVTSLRGAIRQLRVWSRPLTAGEIAHWAQTAASGGEPGLLAAWPCDDGFGRTARDLGPHGLPLAVVPGRNGGHPQWVRTAILEQPYFAGHVQEIDRELHQGRLIDLDLDGDLDLLSWSVDYSSFEPQPLRAWRNGGGGELTDATDALITPPGAALEGYIELAAADFDGDGREDLLGADYGADLPPYPGGQPRLLMRRLDGGLTDETASRLPAVRLGSFRALIGDLDGDGDVDACLPQYRSAAPAVLLNDGSGHLALADGRLAEATDVGYTQGAVLDADGDGDLDLYLGYQGHINADSADIGRDHLFLNDGAGHFARAPATALPPRYRGLAWNTGGAATADLDGDGRADLALVAFTGHYEKPRFLIFLANGDGTFRDGSAGLPQTTDLLDGNFVGMLAVHANADGLPDLVITGQDGAIGLQRLLLNAGGARFVDATEALPLSHALLLPGDIEGDGDLDLVAFPNWRTTILTLEAVRPLDVATWGDFSLGMEPGEIDVGTGISRRAQIVVVRGGFPAPITLEAATDAPGLTVSLTDTELTGDEPVELVVTAAGNAPPGEHRVRVIARSGDAVHVTELFVHVHRTLGSRVRRGGSS